MTTKIRAPHFKYARPKTAPNVAVTADDDRILLETYRHDIIDAKTVFKLLARRSEDRIRRRLRQLFDAGYLKRLPQLEQVFVPGGGSRPVAYTLAPKGAQRVQEAYGLKTKPDRYRERDKRLSAQHILHTLEQTHLMVVFRSAVDARDDVDFLYPDEIYSRFAPHILDKPTLPSAVRAQVHWHNNYREVEGTIPDGFFMLHFKNRPAGKPDRRSIFLEIDRGTETIDVNERKQKTLQFWKDTSLLRKFVVYTYAHKRKVHETEFGIPTFQVLTVTTNRDRVAKMQETIRKHLGPDPHNVDPFRFVFTDFETIAAHDNILSVPFEKADGKQIQLV